MSKITRHPTALLLGGALTLAAWASALAEPAVSPPKMLESDIVHAAEAWKNRVFLVVADGGPSHVAVDQVLENPRRLFRKRRVGCAVCIDGRRYLLTTATLVRDNPEVEVFNDRGEHVLAQIVGVDPYLDIALLKAIEDLPETENLDPMETAESVQVGSSCMVLGNAFGRSLSATLGTVEGMVEIVPSGLPIRVHRVRAPIHPGDSGGPVLDRKGRFLGIVTAACVTRHGAEVDGDVGQSEIRELRPNVAHTSGFAVPAVALQRAWVDLRDFGHVRRGYLGVEMSVADEGLGGARILNVVPDSPAATVGIRPGDLVTTFGPNSVFGPRQLCALVAGMPPHMQTEVRFVRGNVEHIVSVSLGQAVRVPRVQQLTPTAAPAPDGLERVRLTSE